MSKSNVTYGAVIQRVRSKLGDAAGRISETPTSLRWSFWPTQPGFGDRLVSDHGVRSAYPVLEEEFDQEVRAIREALEELGCEPGLSDWQKGSEDVGRKLMIGLNMAAGTLSIWDDISVPIRRRGNVVFRLWSPRDVAGTPVIKCLPVDTFIIAMAQETASQRFMIDRLQKWRIGAIVLAYLLFLAVLLLFR